MNLLELITSANEDDARRMAETFRFMEQQKIKKALAPQMWEEFQKQLKANCKEIEANSSRKLTVIAGTYEIDVKSNRGRRARFTFNPDVPCIIFTGYDDGGHFAFRALDNGEGVDLVDTKRNVTYGEPSEVVFRIMEYLLK